MKALIVLAIAALVFYGGRALLRRYQEVERATVQPGGEYNSQPDAKPATPGATVLEGMSPNLEPALEAAEKQGATGLRNFLTRNQSSIRDPRLADIELDYVVLLSRQDPAEAKRVFQLIKARVPTSSPVYPRIKKLESTFQ